MRHRRPAPSSAKRTFTRTAMKTHKANLRAAPMRGGIRL